MEWSSEQSRALYGIDYWGEDYFGINSEGRLEATPNGVKGSKLDLLNLVTGLTERGIHTPLLIRFPDIIRARVELISNCFHTAFKEYGYKGGYCGVYPIKVNQQRHLVEEIVNFGRFHRLGMECGSKPELLITLALMDNDDAVIVCNGFKDEEYIETALLSQKLGRQTFIVIDRFAELDLIIKAAKKLNIKPNIGVRTKLNSRGEGKWVESSGARSKFGLTPSEIVSTVKILKEEDLLDCLKLVHFHIGSQVPSIQTIKTGLREGVRVYTELFAMGANPTHIDVGGGLGVDYDGSGHGDSSTNYTEQEYANDVVFTIQTMCNEKNIEHPQIITECGRSLVAHSSVLVFDVLGRNKVAKTKLRHEFSDKDSQLVRDLVYMYETVNEKNINEYYNDLIEKKRDTSQLFSYGVLSLEQRAKAEDLYWAITTKMNALAKEHEDFEDIYWQLEQELSDTYYCNFSVFQSLPDSWAINQRFPVMPIHRLNEAPMRRAVLVDLTCDSDGRIDRFIDSETAEAQAYLEVHELKPDEPYYLAVFLTGAYQEILGDLHNLFGDTNAVHIYCEEGGYHVDKVVYGDSVAEVLDYVEYKKDELLERMRKSSEAGIVRGLLSQREAKLLLRHYEQGLSGYTYLEYPDEESF